MSGKEQIRGIRIPSSLQQGKINSHRTDSEFASAGENLFSSCEFTKSFLREVVCSELGGAAVGVEVEGARYRLRPVQGILSRCIAGRVDAICKCILQSSGSIRCELSRLFKNFCDRVREARACDTVHDNLADRYHAIVRLVAGFAPDDCSQKVKIAVVCIRPSLSGSLKRFCLRCFGLRCLCLRCLGLFS